MNNWKSCGFALLTCFLIVATSPLQAQKFEAFAVAGINAAQIDGDDHAGFNKLGFTAGLKTIYSIQDAWAGGLELLFSQRGSRPELNFGSASFQSVIQLNYIEIPIYAQYRVLYDEEFDYYQLSFHSGLSFGRLINFSLSEDSQYTSLEEGFKNNDLSLIFGANYSWSPSMGVSVRYTRAFTYLFKDPRPDFNFDSLQGYFLTFRLEYRF